MTRFFSLMLLGLGLFGLAACNTPGCLVQDKLSEVGANFFASVGECSEGALLKADFEANVVSHFGLCAASESGVPAGVLADSLCPTIAVSAVTWAKSLVPSKYGCKLSNLGSFSVEKLTALCKMIPVSAK